MRQVASNINLPPNFVTPNRSTADNFRVRDFSLELSEQWQTNSTSKCSFTRLEFAHYAVVINNGVYDAEQSDLPANIDVTLGDMPALDLSAKNRISNALFALNLANKRDDIIINIDKDAVIDQPICIYYVNGENSFCCPRVQFNVAANAKVTLLEQIVSTQRCWSNAVLQVNLAGGACCSHYQLGDVAESAKIMQNVVVNQSACSNYVSFNLQAHANWQRLSLHINLEQGASCDLRGLMLGAGNSNQQQHLFIDHLGSNTTSQQNYRALAAASRVSFLGRVTAAKDLKSIVANQKSDHLLLDKNAKSDNQPQLQIYTEDVQCTHGATVGALDQNAIFYLTARGLDRQVTQQILATAFAEQMLVQLPDYLQAIVRQQLATILDTYLGRQDA